MSPADISFDDLLLVMVIAVAVPLLLAMLLAVRGLPVLLLRRDLERAELVSSALLQATSLSFIVVAAQIGVTVHELKPINAASLVAAGMLSVLFFPAAALKLLQRGRRGADPGSDPDERAVEGM